MMLLLWLRFILFLIPPALILVWLLTGRNRMLLLRLAGASMLLAVMFWFFSGR